MTTAQNGAKVVSLTHRPLFTPRKCAPGTHICYKLSRPQDNSAFGRILCQWKIPVTPSGTFFIVVICLHVFCRHNRARYPLTRLDDGHKTQSETVWVLVKRWSRWMRLGLFSRIAFPRYSYHPVHFLGLGTTSYGLPFVWSCAFRHCSNNRYVVSSAVMKFATPLRLLDDWFIFHLYRPRKSIRSCNVRPRCRFSLNVTNRDSIHSNARWRCGDRNRTSDLPICSTAISDYSSNQTVWSRISILYRKNRGSERLICSEQHI